MAFESEGWRHALVERAVLVALSYASFLAFGVVALRSLGVPSPGELARVAATSVLMVGVALSPHGGRRTSRLSQEPRARAWVAVCAVIFSITGVGFGVAEGLSVRRSLWMCVALGLAVWCEVVAASLPARAVVGRTIGLGRWWWFPSVVKGGLTALLLLVAIGVTHVRVVSGNWGSSSLQFVAAGLALWAVRPWDRRRRGDPRVRGSQVRLRMVPADHITLLLSIGLIWITLQASSVAAQTWCGERALLVAARSGDRDLFMAHWRALASRFPPGLDGAELSRTLRLTCVTANCEGTVSHVAGAPSYTYARGPTGVGDTPEKRKETSDIDRRLLIDGLRKHFRVTDTDPSGHLEVILDLGDPYALTEVTVWTYRDGGGGTSKVALAASSDGLVWRQVDLLTVNEDYDASTSFELDYEPAQKLLLGFSGEGTYYTNALWEVEVKGHKIDVTCPWFQWLCDDGA